MFNPRDLVRTLPTSSSTTTVVDQKGVGFWPRALARIIDLVVHYAVVLITSLSFGMILGLGIALFTNTTVEVFMAKMKVTLWTDYILLLLGFILYETICESIYGSTLGKLILGMTVVKEDGSRCGWWPALIRSFGFIIDSLFIGAVGASVMASSPVLKQRFGDKQAHTYVTKWKDMIINNKPSGWVFLIAFLAGCIIDGLFVVISYLIKII